MCIRDSIWNSIKKSLTKELEEQNSSLKNYLQKNLSEPVSYTHLPFGNYFDAGMVYAPIMGANVYFGLDFKF